MNWIKHDNKKIDLDDVNCIESDDYNGNYKIYFSFKNKSSFTFHFDSKEKRNDVFNALDAKLKIEDLPIDVISKLK